MPRNAALTKCSTRPVPFSITNASPDGRNATLVGIARPAATARPEMPAMTGLGFAFGDIGKPNAPMVEIINGLQALTQGGLATMDPTRLEMTVRFTIWDQITDDAGPPATA